MNQITIPMKHTSFARITALAATFIFVGCSGEDERVAPLKADVEASLSAGMPPFLALASMETEVIPLVENRVKINFKAMVEPKEDLYIADRHYGEDRSLMVLKKSQAAGAEANLYGSMLAERTMDKWNISRPEIESGMAQLGSPRGSFDPRAMIEGSDKMKKFIAAREAELAERARAEKEQSRKSEEARLALVERERVEQEEIRKKLTEATAVGKRYRGMIVQSPGQSYEVRQAVELLFTSQSGALITAELHNPDQPEQKQTFTGELVFEPNEDSTKSGDGHHPIILSPKNPTTRRVSENERDRFRIYFEEGSVRLGLTGKGLEGKASTNRFNHQYSLRLQLAE